MAIVTISRQIGAGGDEIAMKIADALGYDLVDNALIFKIAERAGVSVEETANYDEKYHSRAVQWLKNFIEPRMGKILLDEGKHMDPETFIEYCKTVIRGIAEEGNVIIVGRAGQFILKDYETAFHVRVVSSEENRVERLRKRRNISPESAVNMIHHSDRMRKNYIERYFKSDWDSSEAYNIIINTSKIDISSSVQLITQAIKTFSKSHDYIPGVRDRRKISIRRLAERRKGERRESSICWTTKDMETAFIREGRPLRNLSAPDRRRTERRKLIRRVSDRI